MKVGRWGRLVGVGVMGGCGVDGRVWEGGGKWWRGLGDAFQKQKTNIKF